MLQIVIYIFTGLLVGFGTAWLIRTLTIIKMKKALQDTEGFLEREKLGKERLQRETELMFQREAELIKKLQAASLLNKQMDEDILLLQKSNEETEHMLKITEPEVYSLKVKLIEATNSLARMKAGIK